MTEENILVEQCLQNDPKAQSMFYKKYSKKMYALCMRYSKSKDDASDIMQEGFIKVFQNLENFRNEGSLEGWVRKIMTNTALNYYKKSLKSQGQIEVESIEETEKSSSDIFDNLSATEIIRLMQELPNMYRINFNLFAIEGYSHKEIAIMLDIPENTSKSNVLRARKILQTKVYKERSITIYNG